MSFATSSEFDTVVLAGGKSERLRGIVPPYHKPFIVIGGKSLLVRAVDSAFEVGARRVIVVATGENAMPVAQLLDGRANVRVVISSGGPARALMIGLEMCNTRRVLVLMSDNVHADGDIRRVVERPEYAVGVRHVSCVEASRFTRLEHNKWVEGPTRANQQCLSNEPHTVAWCGPLVVSRVRAIDVLVGQEKIGPVLGELAPTLTHVEVNSTDVGIPSIVNELTEE